MPEFQGYCCEACFDNEYISDFIRENGEFGDCPYCKSKDVIVHDTKSVGDFIKAGLRRAYEEADYTLVKEGLCHPLSVHDILVHEECIFSERLLDLDDTFITLMEDLMDSHLDVRDIKHGEERDLEYQDIFADNFIHQGDFFYDNEYETRNAWEHFKYLCQHYNRFFDISSEESRERLLKSLGNVWKQVQKTVRKGVVMHRIRAYSIREDDAIGALDQMDAYREIGPAPYTAVKHNRMSPAGIPYIYLSNNIRTCSKETRIQDGQDVLLGKFSVRSSLRMLDLTTKNVESLPRHPGSIFSEKYDADMLWIRDFLLQFAHEISKPIQEDVSNLEYVPTQLMAEYIRKSGYQGIIFSSSVNPSGSNYVLFYGPIDPPAHSGFDPGKLDVLSPYTEVLELKELSYGRITLAPSYHKYKVRTSSCVSNSVRTAHSEPALI